ncbi:hypothetical protein D9M70_507030 [compost metagenome]
MLADIGIGGEPRIGHCVFQAQALAGAQHLVEHSFGQRGCTDRFVAQQHRSIADSRLRRNTRLACFGEDQHTAFGAGLFDGRAHHHVDQFLQDDLPRSGLGHLEHGSEVQMLHRGGDGRGWTVHGLLVAQVAMPPLKLTHLAVGTPAQVAVASVLQVDAGNLGQAACAVKAPRQLVGQRLNLHEAMVLRLADGLFVKQLRVDQPPVDPGDFCAHQRHPTSEGFGALPGPFLQLHVMADQLLQKAGLLAGIDGVESGCQGQRSVEVILGLLREGFHHP